MKDLLTITFYELKRIFRDRRLTLIVLSQPFVIALITGFLAFRDPVELRAYVRVESPNAATEAYVEKLRSDTRLSFVEGAGNAEALMRRGELRAEIVVRGEGQGIGSVEVVQDTVLGPFRGALQAPLVEAMGGADSPPITATDAGGRTLHHFDFYASAIVSLLIILVVLNLSGISITSDRMQGTFERLAVTPYSKLSLIGGKAVAQALIGSFVAGIGLLSFYLLFDMAIGNIWLIGLISLLTVFTAVAMGLFISTITKSVVESVQLAMYTFFVSFLTSGLNGPFESVHPVFLKIMKMTPVYYAVDASRRVNMMGADWADVSYNLWVLAGFFAGFLILALSLLRKEVK